jgi:hypothetical protein
MFHFRSKTSIVAIARTYRVVLGLAILLVGATADRSWGQDLWKLPNVYVGAEDPKTKVIEACKSALKIIVDDISDAQLNDCVSSELDFLDKFFAQVSNALLERHQTDYQIRIPDIHYMPNWEVRKAELSIASDYTHYIVVQVSLSNFGDFSETAGADVIVVKWEVGRFTVDQNGHRALAYYSETAEGTDETDNVWTVSVGSYVKNKRLIVPSVIELQSDTWVQKSDIPRIARQVADHILRFLPDLRPYYGVYVSCFSGYRGGANDKVESLLARVVPDWAAVNVMAGLAEELASEQQDPPRWALTRRSSYAVGTPIRTEIQERCNDGIDPAISARDDADDNSIKGDPGTRYIIQGTMDAKDEGPGVPVKLTITDKAMVKSIDWAILEPGQDAINDRIKKSNTNAKARAQFSITEKCGARNLVVSGKEVAKLLASSVKSRAKGEELIAEVEESQFDCVSGGD